MPALHVHLPAQFYMFLLSPTDSCRCCNIKNRVYIYTEHLLRLASPTHCLSTPPMGAGSNPLHPSGFGWSTRESHLLLIRLMVCPSNVHQPWFPCCGRKSRGPPSTTIVFLGIEIDSSRFEHRLPKEKLIRLNALTSRDLPRGSQQNENCNPSLVTSHMQQRWLQLSGIGRSSGISLRPPTIPKMPGHWVCLNLECRADIAWWHLFISSGDCWSWVLGSTRRLLQ